MKKNRKDFSGLIPPKGLKDVFKDGKLVGKEWEHLNDHGREIDGRIYSYHPTKGWRSISAKTQPMPIKTRPLYLLEKLAMFGSRSAPYARVGERIEEAGTVVREKPLKVLKQPRKVIVTQYVPVGKYIPGGEHMRLGKANA